MVGHVLVVASDRSAGVTLTRVLFELGVARVTDAYDFEQAQAALEDGAETALIFAETLDSLSLRVVRAAVCAYPARRAIVVSDGNHPELFALARAGARAHLTWPTNSERLKACLEDQDPLPFPLEDGIRSLVGRVGMKEVLSWLRSTMLREALTASKGSRRATARMLGVTRPAIQRMLREDCPGDLLDDTDDPSGAPTASLPPSGAELRPSGVVRVAPARERSRKQSS